VTVQFPDKLQFLFEPYRYKVPYGGRGGTKSWGIARALLLMGAQRPLRILCTREIQKSIADSVHHLLESQIPLVGLEGFYEVQKASILGKNGTEFIFSGLRDTANLKSYEAVDVCWVEEAANVSKRSWDILIPTIRKEGSEIWISFNPELDTDETYKRFVLNPPPNAKVVKVNYTDNPWFNTPGNPLRAEMEYLKKRDFDSYLTVWEGHCRQVLDGAIYANEIREATKGGRICRVPYDPSKRVHTFWDLGWADFLSIWFVQSIAFEYRVIDFHQDQFKALDHYLRMLQDKRYVYGTHWLPHDAKQHDLGSGRSIEELMRAAGCKVNIVPRLSPTDGINAARTIFPQCYFDEEKTVDGLNALRRYRYDVDQNGQFSRIPAHDDASHGADAFRYLAVAVKQETKPKPMVPPSLGRSMNPHGFMA
jgi:phage terminase large subunit